MKSTGIIRRIDDLGRVVIPREIRRTFAIKECDPLEIFICDDGIMLKKYDYTTNITTAIEDLKSAIDNEYDVKSSSILLNKIKEIEDIIADEKIGIQDL